MRSRNSPQRELALLHAPRNTSKSLYAVIYAGGWCASQATEVYHRKFAGGISDARGTAGRFRRVGPQI